MYFFAIAAGAIASYLVVATFQRPRPAEFLALILWAAYAVYEYLVANGTLCDANCNIRVDLVLFLPLLGWATYLALRKETRTGAVAVLAVICLVMTAALAHLFGSFALAVGASLCALIVGVYGFRSRFSSNQP